MTKNAYIKNLIRQRIALTGETYTTAQKLMRFSNGIGNKPISTDPNSSIEDFLAARQKQREQWQSNIQALNISDLITDEQQLHTVTEALKKPGVVLVSGLTAGGKTTVMRTLIKHQISQQNHVAQIDLDIPEISFHPKPEHYTHYLAEEAKDFEGKTGYLVVTEKHAAAIQQLAQNAETLAFNQLYGVDSIRLLNPYLTSHTSLVEMHAGNPVVAYASILERANIAGMDATKLSENINLIITATYVGSEIKNINNNPSIKKVHYTIAPVTEEFKKLSNSKHLTLSEAQRIYEAEHQETSLQAYLEQLLTSGIIRPNVLSNSSTQREKPYEVV